MPTLEKPIKIKFRNPAGEVVEDEIKEFFNHDVLLEPYGRNHSVPAAALTKHSWIELSNIVEFIED